MSTAMDALTNGEIKHLSITVTGETTDGAKFEIEVPRLDFTEYGRDNAAEDGNPLHTITWMLDRDLLREPHPLMFGHQVTGIGEQRLGLLLRGAMPNEDNAYSITVTQPAETPS